jgi:hypothetical protein
VALHWDWVCDRLDAARLGRLVRYTRLHLHIVNSLPHPAAASVLG